jgi:hypothetical protein
VTGPALRQTTDYVSARVSRSRLRFSAEFRGEGDGAWWVCGPLLDYFLSMQLYVQT